MSYLSCGRSCRSSFTRYLSPCSPTAKKLKRRRGCYPSRYAAAVVVLSTHHPARSATQQPERHTHTHMQPPSEPLEKFLLAARQKSLPPPTMSILCCYCVKCWCCFLNFVYYLPDCVLFTRIELNTLSCVFCFRSYVQRWINFSYRCHPCFKQLCAAVVPIYQLHAPCSLCR